MPDSRVPVSAVPEVSVARAGSWTVAHRPGGEVVAVSSRCRHQLADLSKGTIGPDGCLVCPWHGARYDLDTGEMTSGPRGFLWYLGRTPGYTQLIRGVGQVLRLRRRPVDRIGDDYVVRD